MSYYQNYQDLINDYNEYLLFLETSNNLVNSLSAMELFFNKDLYLNTQPIIPPNRTINMKINGVNKYEVEQPDIDNIFNFFGGEKFAIGRKWYEYCQSYRNRSDEGLVSTINNIKVEYGF